MKRFCRKLALPLFILPLFLMPTSVRATTVVMLTDTELIVNSRLIVSGRVTSVTSAWDDAHSMVWTYVEVVTDRVLKGELRETTIVLKQMGGTVGGSGVRVFGEPGFSAGERVLLYLNTAPDGSLHAAHTFMGKFSIASSAGTDAEIVERSVDANDVEFLASSGTGDVTNRASFAAYVKKIQETLREQAWRVAQIDAGRANEPMVAVPAEYSRKKRQSRGLRPEFVFFAGGVRWMQADSDQPISYYINPNGSPVAGGGAAEIARAMTAWPNQSGASIRLQTAGQTSACGIVIDNSNTISFGDCLNQLDPPVGCSGVVALTAINYTNESKVVGGISFNRLLEADTVFNKGMNCFLATSANLAEVACHELGHSIGLGHPADPAAIMWATAHGGGRDATLGADDKTGILAIYPAGASGGPGPGGGGTPVSITTLGMSSGTVGQKYRANLAAAGGVSPYIWSLVAGAIPPGLGIAWDGSINGTPFSAGTYSFAVQVSDAEVPARIDSRWFSITIQPDSGSGLPVITGIRVKGTKKLWVFGQNLSPGSVVLINGIQFGVTDFEQDGSVDQLFVKGKLNVGPTGTNVIVVITANNNSQPYVF